MSKWLDGSEVDPKKPTAYRPVCLRRPRYGWPADG